MSELSVKDLLEAGCHFGHQTARWNPKMKPFIYAAKNGVHIIDLDKTVESAVVAFKFIADRVALGESVIFVGTKRQAADIIREQAERVGMYYVNQRWLGGMLTNFKTIKASIDRLQSLYQRRETGEFAKLTKKEGLSQEREIEKLEHSLGGIKNMNKLPSIVFIIDPKTEHIALHEAQRLKLPIVAITDTNCDPDDIDFVVPANDDAIRSITLLISFMADACAEGLKRREAVIREEVAAKEKDGASRGAPEDSGRVREKKMSGQAKAYVADVRPDSRKDRKGPSKQVKTEKTATEVKKEIVTS
jgi:small subunit ribosomal protein S2